MENRAFNEMLKVARGWLAGRDPDDIARRTGFFYDAGEFRFESLGRGIRLSYPDYVFRDELAYWHQLVVLHYMHHSDGFPILEKQVSFANLKDGMIRGGGFDRDSAAALGRIADGKDESALLHMFASIGGERVESNADVCVKIPFLPRYPVLIKVWLEDDEFPAEGRMLLDESADHYLPVEDAVTVGSIVLEELASAAEERS